MLRSGPIGTRLTAFLKKDDPAFQFETADGRSIGGRHFTVRFARLTLLPGQPVRCMISLIDKTAQVETERSLRSEMLRDTPDRPAQPLRLQREGRGGAGRSRISPTTAMRCSPST